MAKQTHMVLKGFAKTALPGARPPGISSMSLDKFTRAYGTTDLTQREKEILNLIAQGMSSKQIADKLSISQNTVSNHRKNMLAKAGAKSSAELVSIGVNFMHRGNSHL
jgi:DNA-binding CsgD family transcriptional regulator